MKKTLVLLILLPILGFFNGCNSDSGDNSEDIGTGDPINHTITSFSKEYGSSGDTITITGERLSTKIKEIKDYKKEIERCNFPKRLENCKKENLKKLSLEEYALGSEEMDNFCYWIEYKLTYTGKYTGQANKGKIYWDSNAEEYKKSGFIKNIEDDEDVFRKSRLYVTGTLTEFIHP
mgnify:CR=1 FL=1